MDAVNVYIAIILNKNLVSSFSSYDDVILLFNSTYPNNKLVIEKYIIDGIDINIETKNSLDDFIDKYSSGKRITISNATPIIAACSRYFISNKLNILSLSLNASTKIIKTLQNVLSYGFSNQYGNMANFLIYKDYQMKYIHVLYLDKETDSNKLYFRDHLSHTTTQADLLNITVSVSYLEVGKYDYNIKEQSMVLILGSNITTEYITSSFIQIFPKNSFIILNEYYKDIKDIFGSIPTLVQNQVHLNFTPLSEKIYNFVDERSDYIYPLYDILFVSNDFTTNGLELSKENYITVNPYKSTSPAWILNSSLSPILNSAPYGVFQFTFTKDVIVGNDKTLFVQYYGGEQKQLPDSYSIFKIAGITPNNSSLINYDDADYYEIYDSSDNLICVKFNSNITNFPIGKNMNIGKTIKTKFIYKFNNEGYFSKLERLFQYDELVPEVNSTMSKKPIKLKYLI